MGQNVSDVIKAANESIRRIELDNGLVLLLKEDHSAAMVAVQFWVEAGSIHEGDRMGGGLSHYLEHMVFKGTPTRPPGTVSTEIANAGGDVNAYTAMDRTVYHCSLPRENWKIGLEVLSDAVFNAAFPEEEWMREREVIFREVDMGEDQPDRVFNRMIWNTAYRVHPYRVPVIGWKEVLSTMAREDLMAYHAALYTPDRAILSIAGAVPLDEMEAAARENLAGIPRRASPPVFIPTEPPQLAGRQSRKTGPYEVTRLACVWHTVDLADEDTPALDVLATVASSGRSSPLVRRLKEERKLALGIDAWSYTPKYPGLFGVTAQCLPENETELHRAIIEEIETWKTEYFDAERLERARREVLMSSIQRLSTMEGQAAEMASGEFYAGNPRYAEHYLKQVSSVTIEDLQKVARKYLSPDNASWVVLAPALEAEAQNEVAVGTQLNVLRLELENSVPVIIREDSRLPLVYVSVVLRGGTLYEPAEKSGITALMSTLLTRGTSTHDAQALANRLEAKSMQVSGFSGRNSYGLMGLCFSEDAEELLQIMAECLSDSRFPADEVDKQKEILLASIRRSLEQPMTHAQKMAREALFGNHPYARSPQGDEETVSALTSADLRSQHQAWFGQGNLAVSIFGDISAQEGLSLAQKHFSSIPAVKSPEPPPPAVFPDTLVRKEIRLPFNQAIWVHAWPGIPADDSRGDVLGILFEALNGLSSDLFMEVRDKRGLAYYTAATQFLGPQRGMIQIYAGTTEASVAEVERLVDAEVERLATSGLRDEEFQRGLVQQLATVARAPQDNSAVAQQCALDEIMGLGYDHSLRLADRLNTLSNKELQQAAKELFVPGYGVVAIVLPEIK